MEVTRVLAAVVSDGDRYLVGQRPRAKRHGGLWEFPGGKTEDGEGIFGTVSRELREELGVEVTRVERPIYEALDPESPFLISFVPAKVRGHPVAHEHEKLFWGTPQELARLDLAPSDRRFVEDHLLAPKT